MEIVVILRTSFVERHFRIVSNHSLPDFAETSKVGTYFKEKLSREQKKKEKRNNLCLVLIFIRQMINLGLRLYLRSELKVSLTVKGTSPDSVYYN